MISKQKICSRMKRKKPESFQNSCCCCVVVVIYRTTPLWRFSNLAFQMMKHAGYFLSAAWTCFWSLLTYESLTFHCFPARILVYPKFSKRFVPSYLDGFVQKFLPPVHFSLVMFYFYEFIKFKMLLKLYCLCVYVCVYIHIYTIKSIAN